MSTVAVTGASGFIGAGAVAHLAAAGHTCVALGRRPVPGAAHRSFVLGAAIQESALDGVDALVHCAYDFLPTAAGAVYERNVVSTANLFRAAQRAGVKRIVLISSMSAYAGTRQIYGRAKLESERAVDEIGGVSLRLGLVWGDQSGGMAGAVQKLTGLPLVPMLGARSHQFTVHRSDVDTAIGLAVSTPGLTGLFGVAHPDPIPTPRLLRGLAALGGGVAGRLLPIPWHPVYLAMRAAEALRVPLPLRADSVLGLVRPAPSVASADVWPALGLRLREFPVA